MVNGITKDINYIIINYNKISEIDLSYFDLYYLPIVGNRSKNIYLELIKKSNKEGLESTYYNHYLLLTELEITFNDFMASREKLEALGLIETYTSCDLVVYVLNAPLKPTEFFNNLTFTTLLKQSLTKEMFEKIEIDLFVTRLDYSSFSNNTKSVDDVFSIDVYDKNEYSSIWRILKTKHSFLTHDHFNYEHVVNEIEPRDLYERSVLRSSDTYELLNSIAFSYSFNSDDIIELLKKCAKSNQVFDEKLILRTAQKIYDSKTTYQAVDVSFSPTVKADSELINTLDTLNSNEVVTSLYGKGLVSSEIAELELLHRKYGFENGFINVLLIYVLNNCDGSFPKLNYFLKIANEWVRKGINSTAKALEYIQRKDNNYKPNTKKSSTPEWVDKHLEDTKIDDKVEAESIDDLKEFFKK